MELDKTKANIGDIIIATIRIDNINNFSGYQLNIKRVVVEHVGLGKPHTLPHRLQAVLRHAHRKNSELHCLEKVVRNLRDSGSKETDPEFERAAKARNQTALDIVQHMKNAFNRLYYPSYDISARAPLLVDMEIDYSSIVGYANLFKKLYCPRAS